MKCAELSRSYMGEKENEIKQESNMSKNSEKATRVSIVDVNNEDGYESNVSQQMKLGLKMSELIKKAMEQKPLAKVS